MKKQQSSSKKITLALLGAMLVLLLLDLTPLGGNSYYYYSWIRCGEQPVHSKGVGLINGVPHYENSPKFAFVRGTTPYFCNEREAELAGYSADASDYSFPNLSDDEARSVLEKK